MASYDQCGVPGSASRRERGTPEGRGRAEDEAERGIGALPGVVNDLPEVAPHEWIYLMS